MPDSAPSKRNFKHLRHAKKRWFDYLLEHKGIYIGGTLFVLATAALQVLATRSVGWVIDFFAGKPIPEFLQFSQRSESFQALCFLLLGTRAFLFLSRVGWRLTIARQTHKASSGLKEDLWDNVRFFSQSDLMRKFTKGVLMNANTSDVASGRFIYGFTLVAMVDVLFLGVLTLATMLSIHTPLTLWSLVALIVVPFFIKKLSTIEMIRYREAQEDLGRFNDLTSQVVSTIRLQRLTQTGKFWLSKLMQTADLYRQKRLSAVFTSLRYIPAMGSASIFSYVVLFFLGIPFVLEGSMTVGDFVAMQGLIFLLQEPLFELGFIISEWRKSFTSLERLSEVFLNERDTELYNNNDSVSLHQKNEAQEQGAEVFSVSNLSYVYEDGNDEVLKNLNFKLGARERLGIIGPIGSGKSTLVKILSGMNRHFDGKVSLYGRKFSDYSHDELREHISVVGQKPFLFADTIRENVRLDRDLSDEDVWYYLGLAGLESDVRDFPNQLGTPLGEWGINLSGGQKQRLTLARALARRSQVYFLDDCLSAVDTITEEKILKNLDREFKEQTLIWVAHRRSTLKYCDQILELQ
jgi:ATP-binding cassette subfamily B protein